MERMFGSIIWGVQVVAIGALAAFFFLEHQYASTILLIAVLLLCQLVGALAYNLTTVLGSVHQRVKVLEQQAPERPGSSSP